MDKIPAFLADTAREISETIEAASTGKTTWKEVCNIYARSFPGCYTAIVNQKLHKQEVVFFEYTGLDRKLAQSYADYYVRLNPWNRTWDKIENGHCLVRSRDLPAHTVTETEFYVDWARKTGDFDAATGLKAAITPTQAVYLTVHYPVSLSETYDGWIDAVSSAQAPVLARAIDYAKTVASQTEQAGARVGLTGTVNEPAVVLDGKSNIVDANENALGYFRQGGLLKSRRNRLFAFDRQTTERLRDDVRRLAMSPTAQPVRLGMRHDDAVWVASLSRIPRAHQSMTPAQQSLVLVRFRNISAAAQSQAQSLGEFARLFCLTAAQTRLCDRLHRGDSLAAAASRLNWTYETARSTLKLVFIKTTVARQVDLIRLMDRFLSH